MALNEQMQQMIQQDIQDAETRPKEEILKEQMEGLKTAGRTARDIAIESIPGVGEEIATQRFEKALEAGDKVGAGVEAAAGIIGIVPGVGDLAAQGIRKTKAPLRKLLDKLPQKEIDALPSQPDDVGIYGYHGTARERKPDEPFFDINFARKNDQFLGEGFYFTLDPKVAEEYSNLRAFRDFDVGPIQKGKDPVLTHRETGQKTTVGNLQKGLDIEGNRLAMGQTVSRFDLSKLEKPFIVRTQADRKKLKENFQKIKEEGYDSVLFADFKDRSKQIMVFPEHMDKIDTSAIAGKSGTKTLHEQDILEAENLVDNPEKLQEWRDANRLPESQRQKNIPEAQKAAEDLFQGNIKSKEARQRIKEVFPEPKLYTAETMPEMPTITDVVGSMGKKAEKGILGVKGFDLEPGQRVGARLDIPAYNEYDKWVVSIHDGKIRNGSVVGYGQAIRLKNIEFGSDPEVALDIAKGKRVAKKSGEEKPMGKATIARVFGDYVPEDPYELQAFAKKVLADKDSGWTQVGMNPYRGSYFYNKETGKVVTRADEVIQVGPLVLAKNVTEPKLSELKELFSQKTARTKDGKLRIFNQGGVVPMKNMTKQMELFEPVERGFDDGGLMDEGGMIDEESGNEVPPGSLREEVRDDIPAQLSEGEFVFPADVVRYIGLEKLMMMRQEAKQGLAQMEAMGQMGNGDEAVVEDDMPFDMYDLDIEDEEEYNSETRNYQVGGYVSPPMPFQQQPYNQPTQVNPQTGTYTLPGTGIAGYQVPSGGQTGFTPYGGAAPYFQPVQFTGPQFQTSLQTTNLPTFGETVGTRPGQYDELRTYVNDAGQILQIPFKDGQPIYPIPEGYKLQSDQPQAETPTTIAPTTGVKQEDDRGGDGPATTSSVSTAKTSSTLGDLVSNLFGEPTTTPGILSQTPEAFFGTAGQTNDIYAGSAKFGLTSDDLRSATFDLASNQLASISPVFGAAKAIGDKLGLDTNSISFNRHAVAGNIARADALDFLGLAGTNQLDAVNSKLAADVTGKAMAAAMEASYKGLNPKEAYDRFMSTGLAKRAQEEVYNTIKNAYASTAYPGQLANVAGYGAFTDADFKNAMDDISKAAQKTLDELGPAVLDSKPQAGTKQAKTHQSFKSIVGYDENGTPIKGYNSVKAVRDARKAAEARQKQAEALKAQAEAKVAAAKKEQERKESEAKMGYASDPGKDYGPGEASEGYSAEDRAAGFDTGYD